MDISAGDRTAMEIFTHILDSGPLTLYSANTKSKIPLGTIHRHFKEMEQSEKIKVYQTDKKGRKKIPYGPTVFGFVFYFRLNKKIQTRLENYFLLWIEHKDFQSSLRESGFDVKEVISNPKKSKHLFRKFIEYGAGVEDQLELFKKGSTKIPRQLSVFVGEMLVSMNPKYQKLWQELYLNLPGLRKTVDAYLVNMQHVQSQLRKKIK